MAKTNRWSSPVPISVPSNTASVHISGLSDISGYACIELSWLDPSNDSISHHRTLSRPKSTPSGYFHTHDGRTVFTIDSDLPQYIELRFSFTREYEDEYFKTSGGLVKNSREKIKGSEICMDEPRVATVWNGSEKGVWVCDAQVIIKAVVSNAEKGKESPSAYVNVVFSARREDGEGLPRIAVGY